MVLQYFKRERERASDFLKVQFMITLVDIKVRYIKV